MAQNEASAPASNTPTTGTITVEQAAGLLMITSQWVRDLAKKGYVPRPAGGRVALIGAVQGYIRWLKDEERRTSKTATASAVQEERAREIRLRNAEKEGQLVAIESVDAVFADVLGVFRSELAGVAAAATRDLTLRGQIDDRINDALDRARGRFEASRDALRAGGAGSVAD